MNQFWQTGFEYWEYCKHLKIKTNEDILTSSIWLNPKNSNDLLFLPDWHFHGINTVGDIINGQGSILSLQSLKQQFNLNINILNYYTVKNCVKGFIEQHKKGNI